MNVKRNPSDLMNTQVWSLSQVFLLTTEVPALFLSFQQPQQQPGTTPDHTRGVVGLRPPAPPCHPPLSTSSQTDTLELDQIPMINLTGPMGFARMKVELRNTEKCTLKVLCDTGSWMELLPAKASSGNTMCLYSKPTRGQDS